MATVKTVPKPRHTRLNEILNAKRSSSAAGVHKPRSQRQKRKSTFQKFLKDGHYD